jgi:hypothetical protein
MGNALTYVQSAAKFDSHGAGQKLLARYDGFSKQRNIALRKLISTMKHTSGTSITSLLVVSDVKLASSVSSCIDLAFTTHLNGLKHEHIRKGVKYGIAVHCEGRKAGRTGKD